MPLSTETIRNLPLSGQELLELVVRDLREVLAKDGMFSAYSGYGRVGYTIHLTLHMDNLTYPAHEIQAKGGEPLPLAEPTEEAVAIELEHTRQIESPNAARILNDLPIKVTSVVGGRPVEHELTGYSKEDVPPQPKPTTLDFSGAATQALRERAKRSSKGPKG